jgi:hypothetical protein
VAKEQLAARKVDARLAMQLAELKKILWCVR